MRISSLTKSKTHGNFLGQPVFLFVKEEFLTREKSSWEGGGGMSERHEFFSSSKRKSSRGENHGGGGSLRSPDGISQNDILLKFQ